MDDLNLWFGGGLFLGLLFGIVVQRTQFCMVTAVSNVVLMRDFRHAHAYFAALLVAILGTLFLEAGGLVAISETGSIRALTAVVAIVAGMLPGIVLLTRTEKIDEQVYHHHQATHRVVPD